MKILAIETCLGALSVAIASFDAAGLAQMTTAYEELQAGHAERLMPMVQATMGEAGIGFGELARIAVTLGPGSFTGVRTGVAAARAFRLATGLEVVGTTSLAVMAHRLFEAAPTAPDERPLLIAVDARRGGIYVQLFGRGALDALSEPQELTPGSAAALGGSVQVRVAGSGARAVAEAARSIGRPMDVVAERLEPNAADLAVLAAMLEPLLVVKPLYIRPPDAKPQTERGLARVP